MADDDIKIVVSPREMFYHEVQYVRALEQRCQELGEFARWVDAWVSNPASAYSVDATEGLFGMARDRLGALRKPPVVPGSHYRNDKDEAMYRLGLEAAAQRVGQWAREEAGGAGVVDDWSRNLAESIRRIDPKKGH